MSTPPLVTVPTSSCVANVTMSLNRVVGMTVSPFSLSEQAFKWPGEQWAMEFAMPPFTSRAVASDWLAFGLKLEGRYGRFLMGDPAHKLPRGIATGTPQVDGGGQAGNTLLTKGWTPGVNGILLKGDYFQLGTGLSSSLHMIVEDADSDSAGDAVLEFVPALKTLPADSSAIVVNEPKGLFRLPENSFSWRVQPGPVYSVSFQAVEVISA